MMTRQTLDRNIETLQKELLILGEMVQQATLQAVEALMKRDLEASRSIYRNDTRINKRRFDIELNCLITIATQQAIASDLRMLASILEVAGELERMGDYAKGIARVSISVGERPLLDPLADLPEMARIAVDMLNRALKAFLALDAEEARRIPTDDDKVDALFNAIYHHLVNEMIANPQTIDEANHLQWAAHNLERLADRVTNICERTIFVATGDMVELDLSDDEWKASAKI
jgi:phosphate transport system protein